MATPQQQAAAAERADTLATKEERLLTVQDVAKMYGVSDETVRRWIRRGAIAYKLVGPFRLKRIPLSEAQKGISDVPKR